MSTRSLTRIIDNEFDTNELLCVIYRQFDGYPEVHGAELKEFLKDKTIVNGISATLDKNKYLANGAGCLAAQLIAHLKDGVGNIYIEQPSLETTQEYVYTITTKSEHPIKLTVQRRNKVIYDGTINDFDPNMEEHEV